VLFWGEKIIKVFQKISQPPVSLDFKGEIWQFSSKNIITSLNAT
jgi:hypothetical protein